MDDALLSKKQARKLASRMNDGVASKPSAFALKQLQKFGWKEGEGIGKNKQGVKSYVKVEQREEQEGCF